MSTAASQSRPQIDSINPMQVNTSLLEALEQRLLLSDTVLGSTSSTSASSLDLSQAILVYGDNVAPVNSSAVEYSVTARASGNPVRANADTTYLFGTHTNRPPYWQPLRPYIQDMSWWYGCSPTTGGMQASWYDHFVAGDLYPGNQHEWVYGRYPAYDSYIFDVPDYPNGVVAGYAHLYDGRYNGVYYSGFPYDEDGLFHAPDSLADFMLTRGDGSQPENIRWGTDNFNAWDDPATPDINESWASYSYFLSELEQPTQEWSYSRKFPSGNWGVNPQATDATPQAWYDYMAEIEAGRPVHMLLLGIDPATGLIVAHSVLGVGYWIDREYDTGHGMSPGVDDPNSWQLNYVLFTGWNTDVEMWSWRHLVNPKPEEVAVMAGDTLLYTDYIWHYIVPPGDTYVTNGYMESASGWNFWVNENVGTDFAWRDFAGDITRPGSPGDGDLTGYLDVMLSEYGINIAQDWEITIGLGDPDNPEWSINVPITHRGRAWSGIDANTYPDGLPPDVNGDPTATAFNRDDPFGLNNLDETNSVWDNPNAHENYHFVKTDIDLNGAIPTLQQMSRDGGQESWFLKVVDTNSAWEMNNEVARILDFQVRYKEFQEDSWFTPERGTSVTGINGGVVQLTSQVYGDIHGAVYHDYNGNHVQDPGEPGIAGVRVFIDNDLDGTDNGLSEFARDATDQNDVRDPGEPFTVTDAAGQYVFRDLTPETYQIRVVDTTLTGTGWVQSQPGVQTPHALAANYESTVEGGNYLKVDFGYYRLGSLSGRLTSAGQPLAGWKVFLDENQNGVWDYVDRNLNGAWDWIDLNGNGKLDQGDDDREGEPYQITDANGNYTFTNLPPRDTNDLQYTVAQVLKDGWVQTNPGNRTWDQVPPVAGTFYVVRLNSSDTVLNPLNLTGLDFANQWAPLPDLTEGTTRSAVPPVVYPGAPFMANWDILNVGDVDTAGSFIVRFYASRDATLTPIDPNDPNAPHDPVLGEVTISQSVIHNGPAVVAQLMLQSFPDLLPGNYYIRVEIDPVLAGQTDPTMQQGQVLERWENNNATADSVNVTLLVPGIRGLRWADFDGDGVQDAGELPVPGQTFYIDSNGNSTLDAGERTSVTDANGEFGFSHLDPGTYLIREVLAAGWQRTYPLSNRYGVPYAQDDLITGVDFGAQPLADLTPDSTDYSTFNPHSVYPPGQSWSIWWDIHNIGTVGAGPFQVDFYATDRLGATTIDPALDHYLGSVNVAYVTAGGYVDVNLALLDFPTLPIGTYHVGVVIDPDNQVWESDETDLSNRLVDPTDELVVFGRPELSTDPLGVINYQPGVITPGVRNDNDPLFEIIWTIRNLGRGDSEDGGIVPGCGFFVQFYASDNAEITTFDYYLGKVWVENLPGMSWAEIRLPMFNFPDIPAGDYYVGAIIDRPNWIDEPVETNNVTATHVYPLRVPGIAGQVVHDINNDGIKDWSESARPGMVMFLDLNNNGIWDFVDLNGNGVWDYDDLDASGTLTDGESFEPFEPSEITDPFGQYSFTSLDSDLYSIKMVKPWVGAELQYAPDPADTAFVDDQFVPNVDFYKTLYSRADGWVWYDYDGDGVYDGPPTEYPMDGWRVYIDSNNNDKLDWVDNPLNPNIDAWDEGEGERWFVAGSLGAYQGLYRFKELVALSPLVGQLDPEIQPDPRNTQYNIRVVPEAFWVMTEPTDFENTVDVTSAHVYPQEDFGEAHAARIRGLVWHDLNVNQVQGQNEPGLSGWTVYLDQNNDGLLNAWEISTLTDLNGLYIFEGLLPGNYLVRQLPPADWHQAYPANDASLSVFAGSAVTVTGVDFGVYQYAQIQGVVWHDIDADRVHRAEEPGLEGWVVWLDANNDGVLGWNDLNGNNRYDAGEGEYWVYAGVDGVFRFVDLMPGKEYIVREVVFNGWAQSAPEFFFHQVYVASGDVITGVEFGNYMPGSISGYAFNDLNGNGAWDYVDLNGNGVWDSTTDLIEPGLEGWVIFLDQNGNGRLDEGETFTATGADGSYSFGNLTPSAYRIVQILRSSDWVQTFPPPPGTYTLTITSGMNWIDADFGDYKYGTISGAKWEDSDADGVWDWIDANKNGIWDAGEAGEQPLSGWTLFLDDNGNGVRDWIDANRNGIWDAGEGERWTTTDANGAYTFTRLSPKDYYVTEVLTAGWIQSSPAVLAGTGFRQYKVTMLGGNTPTVIDQTDKNKITGNVITGANFGNYRSGQITGTKWNDVNGNGVLDVTEPGLADVVVYLDINENGVLDWVDDSAKPNFGRWDFGEGEQWTTTNSMGAYTLGNLTPGIYTVAEVPGAGWIQSYPFEITGLPDQAGILIASGTTVPNINFGNYQYGRISGLKWNDLNGNGLKDIGEAGLPGWAIMAFPDLDLDGVIDPAEMVLSRQVTTGDEGSYEIIGLKIGQYIVSEVSQENWAQTFPGGTGLAIVTILSGTSITDVNFGNVHLAKISGTVWHDLNADGLWSWVDTDGSGDWSVGDTGEPPLAAWIVLLDEDGDGQRDWTDLNNNFVWNSGEGERWLFTSTIGTYLFDKLLPGTYSVTLIQEPNWIRSFPATPVQAVTVEGGQYITGRNFGEYQNGSISGVKWSDLDADGIKDAGEPGLGGWTIYLDSDADRQLDWVDGNANGLWDAGEGEQFTVTAADGSYSFAGLKPGTYIVREINQAGWIQMQPANNTRLAIVVSGQDTAANDFGNVQSATITGFVWRDVDSDGVFDAGNPFEIVLPGWQIYLDSNQDGVLDWTDANANGLWDAGEGERWTTTDANGVYSFTGLLPNRTYTVATVLQDGFVRTYPAGGVYDVTVQAGDTVIDRDFGMKQLPVARDLALATDEDVPAAGTMPAESPDGAPLTWIVDSYPIHGQLAFNAADGSFTYTPNPHYNGPDSFTFHVVSGVSRSNTGRVDLTVRPVNQVPTSQDQLVRVINGRTTTITLAGTDLETAFDQLVFRIISGPTSGTLTQVSNGRYLYTPFEGFCGVDSFIYDVTDTGDPAGSMLDPKTSPQATVTINVVRAVDIQANRWASYTDANGDTVRLLLSGSGSGTMMFAGTGWADLDYLYLTGTTATSALTISTAGSTSVRDIGVTGALRSIIATTTDLTGNLTLGGGLAQLMMRDVRDPDGSGPIQHTISIGANGTTTATYINLQAISDLTVISQSPISTFLFRDWTDRIGPVDSVQAQYITSLYSVVNPWRHLAGNFPASLNLTSQSYGMSLRSASIAGALTSPTMTLAGAVGSIMAASWPSGRLQAAYATTLYSRGAFGADLNLTGQNAYGNSLTLLYAIGRVTSDSITLTGAAGTIIAGAWAAAQTTARSITSLISRGDFTGNLVLTGQSAYGVSLASLSITGTGRLLNSEIRTRGGLGTLMASSIIGSKVFVCTRDTLTAMPTNGAVDFLAPVLPSRPASITMLYITSLTGVFQNSIIAAPSMGTAILRGVMTANGGTAFGLGAHTRISSFTRYIPNARALVRSNITGNLVADGNFQVNIV